MIFILSGTIGIGKSNGLLKWTEGREDTFGILTPRDDHGMRYLFDVGTKKCFGMQTESETAGVILVGRYRFLKTAFNRGNNIIKKAIKCNKSGYVIIDELGKLELQSKGFHESAVLAINATTDNHDLHLILIIRTTLLVEIIKKYNIIDYQSIEIQDLNQHSELIFKSHNKRNL